MEQLANGDFSAAAKQTGDIISWTVEHKDIFSAQYILSLDETLLAADENYNTRLSYGDSFISRMKRFSLK
ncbi:hypothetical protein ACFSUR_28315 [Halalkalibacter alkalisediminis]|uniref:hypothetical protein n=1 Tax=Halalkalibacter alkalisediminis TaxID=935616 RepID=UPI003634EB61